MEHLKLFLYVDIVVNKNNMVGSFGGVFTQQGSILLVSLCRIAALSSIATAKSVHRRSISVTTTSALSATTVSTVSAAIGKLVETRLELLL